MSGPVEVDPSQEGRTALDVYPTPQKTTQKICERLKTLFPDPKFIIEPSAGSGVFVRELRLLYPTVPIAANEIRTEEAHALAEAGANYVYHEDWEALVRRWRPPEPVLIVGNPPFSLATRHVAAPMEVCAPGTNIAYLLKQNIKGGKDRAMNFWPKFPHKFEIPLTPRPSFKKTSKASNDTNEYSVFIWEVGYTGPSITLFPHIIWK